MRYGVMPREDFKFSGIGVMKEEDIDACLADLGLARGERYDHDHCPISPSADSDAKACVVVLEKGIMCHPLSGARDFGPPPSAAGLPPSARPTRRRPVHLGQNGTELRPLDSCQACCWHSSIPTWVRMFCGKHIGQP